MFEDLKKSQRGNAGPAPGSSPRPFSLFTVRDPKLRLFLLGLGLVLVVGIMLGLKWYVGEPREDHLPETPAGFAVDPQTAPPAFSGTPVIDPRYADRIRDADDNDRRWWQQDVMSYLLLEARNTPAVQEYARNLLPLTPGSAAEIRRDSAPWRLKYVRFRGELEYIREEDHEEVYGPSDPPIGRVHRGRVRVGEGESSVHVLFVTPIMPLWADPNEQVPRPESKLIEDGWVRGRGLFVKNFIEEAAGGDVECLLVVATLIERDYRPVPVNTLDDIPFDLLHDDPAQAASEDGRLMLAKEYPRALYRLVKYAAARAGDAGAPLRAQEKLEPAKFPSGKEYEELCGQAGDFRARYFGGLGAIALAPMHYTPETIEPNDAGVEECLNGWILTDGQKLFQFVAPAALAGEWKKRTRIRFEGYFYKTKLYPTRLGTDQIVPMMVLTVLEEVKPGKVSPLLQIVFAIGFCIGLVALFVLVLREDKTKESFRRQWRKRAAAARN